MPPAAAGIGVLPPAAAGIGAAGSSLSGAGVPAKAAALLMGVTSFTAKLLFEALR
jgi:hypothetical protein